MTFLLYNQPLWVFLMLLHFGTYPKLPVHALIHDPQKKKLRASTRAHDPFFDEPKI